ncbi:MAG: hypothetical protein K9H26_07715 [Prolixibacteraceae bacterium]|nr:hypothetical protein [Prolixibacteraceae bacterium]
MSQGKMMEDAVKRNSAERDGSPPSPTACRFSGGAGYGGRRNNAIYRINR